LGEGDNDRGSGAIWLPLASDDSSVLHCIVPRYTVANIHKMPSLSRWLNSLNVREHDSSIPTENVPAQTVTSYFLAPSVPPDPTSSSPILYAVPPPNKSQKQPPGSLHFGLTHPSSASSSYETSTFFLSCVPDPIGYLAHSASFIRSHLGSGSSGPSKWRHSDLHLILEDEDGLAYTSAGKIHISLRWVGDLERQVKDGARDMQSATKEIKGVCECLCVSVAIQEAG
jgi:hypothetical protein